MNIININTIINTPSSSKEKYLDSSKGLMPTLNSNASNSKVSNLMLEKFDNRVNLQTKNISNTPQKKLINNINNKIETPMKSTSKVLFTPLKTNSKLIYKR